MRALWDKNRARALCAVLILLGVAKPLGMFVHSLPLIALGNTLASSPAPRPFLSVRAYEDDPSRGVLLSCRNDKGVELRERWSRSLRARLSGPHRRAVVFVNLLNFFRADMPPAMEAPYRRALCPGGALHLALGCPADTTEASIELLHPGTGTQNIKRFACSH